MGQPNGLRDDEQSADANPARRLAHESDSARVAAKGRDVGLDLQQGQDLLAEEQVARESGVRDGGGVFEQVEEAQAVVEGHDDDAPARDEVSWLEKDGGAAVLLEIRRRVCRPMKKKNNYE